MPSLDFPAAIRAIGGYRSAASARRLTVSSPIDGAIVAVLGDASLEDVGEAVAIADRAFKSNLRATYFERSAWCDGAAAVIAGDVERLASLLTRENGKTIDQARAEVMSAARGFRLAGEEARRLTGETIPVADPAKLVLTRRVPRGVYAVVTPFNFPLNIPVEYLGPILAGGNSAVWRPSPTTSAVAHALMDCLDEAGVPEGLIVLVTGQAVDPVRALVSHPAIEGVCFTGSTAVGLEIAREAYSKTRLMELGGNGPCVVLPDADIERTAKAIVSAAAFNSGQSCSAPGRVVVAESIADQLVDALVAQAQAERVGNPFDHWSTMGPIHTDRGAERLSDLVAHACERGAKVVAGGGPEESEVNRKYWPLTVLTGVEPGDRVVSDETFGPIVPVLRVEDSRRSILAAANSSAFGLSAAVFGRDLDRTVSVAQELRAGQVIINDTSNYWELHMPFGGAAGSASGTGRLGGAHAAQFFSDLRSISLDLGEMQGPVR